MKKTVLNIEGMTCSACSNGLEKYLNKQKGIHRAEVNLVMATALIEYDDNLTIEDLNKMVQGAGFKSLGERNDKKEKRNELKKVIIFSILGIVLMYISMGAMINLPVPQIIDMNKNPIIYSIVIAILSFTFLIYGFDIIKNGIKNIIHKMPNMDSLVGIGVIVNFLYSLWNTILVFQGQTHMVHHLYFESSAIIILFVKIGRYIDGKNKNKAVDSIKNLVTITPKNGTILKDGNEKTVTINEIEKGDIVICKPGEKIAVDGKVTKGETHTDESFITGESKPVTKKVGSKVLAGSINYDGYIEYEAERIGKDSSISQIVNLVVEATNTKAPIARLADKISGYFVPAIFLIAILSFILNLAIYNEIDKAILSLVSVLVVACPCALGLATPLAMIVAIGNCSKRGVLIKSSESIEALKHIDTIVFDKTGTLTEGKLSIVDGEYTKENMKILQSLEAMSNHPIAKSMVNYRIEKEFKSENKESNIDKNGKANTEKITNENQKKDKEQVDKKHLYEIKEFKDIPGKGIQGKINGKTYYAGNQKLLNEKNIKNIYAEKELEYSKKGESIVYLFDEKEVLAIVGLSDKIKDNMEEIIQKIKENGYKVIMLTGDNETTAKAIAKKLNIEEVISNVSPKEKQDKIKEINKNNSCLMVGDGINDSPALKTATVGISVANGTDMSADSADIILLKDNMNLILEILNIGKKTIRIVKQNLFWALFYNICMIPLAMGILPVSLNPMIASLAMTFSSLTVVLNSLRLSFREMPK